MVFPGGQVCKADFEGALWKDSVPLDARYETRFRPPMYNELVQHFQLNKIPEHLHPSVGLRLCALRELFEETGLLLVENKNCTSSSASAVILDVKEVYHWQNQLLQDPSSFPKLYTTLGQRPPLGVLFDWSNWLTPKKFQPRFDTLFYFVHLDSIISDSTPVASSPKWKSYEVDTLFVGKPSAFLYGSTRSLVPPQMYELGRLCHFTELDSLTAFAQHRASLGCRRWCPVPTDLTIAGQRCTVYFVPGDQRYDQVARLAPSKLTSGELASDIHRNRLVISSDAPQLWWDTSVYELGHVAPMTRAEYQLFCS